MDRFAWITVFDAGMEDVLKYNIVRSSFPPPVLTVPIFSTVSVP